MTPTLNKSSSFLSMFLTIGCITLLVIFFTNVHLLNYIRNVTEINTVIVQITDEVDVKENQLKSVLFIIVDDLRPQLEPYIDEHNPDYFSSVKIRTPNLDRLAAQSIVFKRAYCQQSLCGPSRASMLTSRRPDVTRAFGNKHYWRDVGGNFTTLPQHFKNNGYLAIGFSKVFHPKESSNNDDPPSWSLPYYRPPFSDSHYMNVTSGAGWAAVTDEQRDTVPLADDLTVRQAKLTLQDIADDARNNKRPFFMAVGFRKPHLSFVCPEKYFRWYPPEGENFLKNNSWQNPVVKKTANINNVTNENGYPVIPSDTLRHLRRAYFACISYMDHNVGELLDELRRLGLEDNTIITFVADHGYHLGENLHFGKMTSDEMSNRIPLMIHIPGVTLEGSSTESLVEAVDVFPTLVEAAGLDPIAPCPVNCSDVELCTQGISLMPLIKQPDIELKQAAFSQVTALPNARYTVRTKRFRYVEYVKGRQVKLETDRYKYTPEWDDSGQTWELYDHQNDTLEQYNLASNPEYQQDIKTLRALLHNYVNRLWEEPKII